MVRESIDTRNECGFPSPEGCYASFRRLSYFKSYLPVTVDSGLLIEDKP